jgi:hypothetical protein
MHCQKCSAPIVGRRADALFCSDRCSSRHRSGLFAKRHPAKVKAHRALMNSNAPLRILSRIKSRAKRDGIPFNLEAADIVIPDVCPVLGIPIVQNQGRQGYFPDSASVDRIVPSQGYVKGNVRVISQRANQLKSDATVAEMRLVLADLERLRRDI